MDYYSARLFMIILVDDGKPKKKNLYDESIVVFKADNHDHAFERALAWGKEQELIYKNSRGQDVRWAFVEVAEVRCIGKKIDGVEIISTMFDKISKSAIVFNHEFKPEEQKLHET